MKKIIQIMLTVVAFAITVFCFANLCFAADFTSDIEATKIGSSSTYYSYDYSTKTLTISGSGAISNMTTSSQPWFDVRSDGTIEHIVVEEGITAIGNYNFYYCTNADFTLPSTLKTINTYAFAYCYSLTQFTVPKGVTSIGSYAFSNCTGLSEVNFANLGSSVSIGSYAFYRCSSLTSVTVPKNVSLSKSSKAFGYSSSSAVYSDFVMYIFRDSSALDYADYNTIEYVIINELEVFEGESVSNEYYDDSVDDEMVFTFVPEYTTDYNFYSTGSVDVDCVLTNSDGDVLAQNDDVSSSDLNFLITCQLSEGETYYFTVTSYKSTGAFDVVLMPVNVTGLELDGDEISFDANRTNTYDILSQIEGRNLTVIYDTQFTESLEFSNDMVHNFITFSYVDCTSTFTCGVNQYAIEANDYTEYFDVTINHSYISTNVVSSTYEQGYTLYSCVLCGDSYKDNFLPITGITINGVCVLDESPTDDNTENLGLSNIKIMNSYIILATTDSTGSFSVIVPSSTQTIQFIMPNSASYTLDITASSGEVQNEGYLEFNGYDFNNDGYINAKDYAIFKKYDYENYSYYDYNQDGVLDDSDWCFAKNFFAIGEISH